MRIIKTTATHEVWQSEYEGQEVQFTKNLLTNEIRMDANHLAKVMGFDSLQEMMADDEILDCINESYRETGVWPITKQNF